MNVNDFPPARFDPRQVFTAFPAAEETARSLTGVKVRDWRRGDTMGMSEKPLIDTAQEKILALAEETRFAPNGIVSRTLLRTASSRVVLFGFAEGQELTEHTSTQHAVIQILSGECEFSLAGKPHALKAGDLVYMPPNLVHAVRATKQFSMLLTLSKPEPQDKA
jgi:quercetin dioxygenase-like cupin family protein